LRSTASAVSGLQALAFLRGGMTAAAPRAAKAPWHLRMSKTPLAVTLAIACSGRLCRQFRQHPRKFARTGGAYRHDVDQKVQRAVGTAIRDVDLQGFLAPRQRADVWHGPIQAGQAQQVLPRRRSSGGGTCRTAPAMVRQDWMAASIQSSCRPRLQVGAPPHALCARDAIHMARRCSGRVWLLRSSRRIPPVRENGRGLARSSPR